MAKLLRWSMEKLIETIVITLLNKFDFQLYIEGKRGLGKSTLAYEIAHLVNVKFRKIEKELPDFKDCYKFNPRKDLLYTRDKVIEYFNKWKVTGIADEFINTAFNRDFYQEDQKQLIKMINMNRDHCNLFIGCVPQFQTLDSQIKNLCKMRITVVRRGVGVIQTPNKTIYIKDIWDSITNEKIEREWVKSGSKTPKYTRLSTVRGVIFFPDLRPKQREIYEKVKIEERNILYQEREKENADKKKDPYDDVIERLQTQRIRNAHILEGMAHALGKSPQGFMQTIRDKLKKKGLSYKLDDYYWEGKPIKFRKRSVEQIQEGIINA